MKKIHFIILLFALLAFSCQSNNQIKQSIPADSKLMALSFDDGPNITTTSKMLDVLEKYKVPASFFVVGNRITDENAQMMLRAISLGCTIENHSWSHSHMSQLSADSITAEIRLTSDIIQKYTGQVPQFFRPPYINVREDMHNIISLPFICGDTSDDWRSDLDVDGRIRNIRERCADGSIVLMHDFPGNDRTVEALDRLIPQLLAEGYRFVTVPELFRLRTVTPENGCGIIWNRVPPVHAKRLKGSIWKRTNVKEFEKTVNNKSYIILDVRHADEYAEGHLPRAINLDVQEEGFIWKAKKVLPTDTPIAVYCRGGIRSKDACRQLAGNGYSVIELSTGILGWIEAGKATTKE